MITLCSHFTDREVEAQGVKWLAQGHPAGGPFQTLPASSVELAHHIGFKFPTCQMCSLFLTCCFHWVGKESKLTTALPCLKTFCGSPLPSK